MYIYICNMLEQPILFSTLLLAVCVKDANHKLLFHIPLG